jgi:hypothetical protein
MLIQSKIKRIVLIINFCFFFVYSSQTTEIRSSFVFRSNDILKKANEREYNLNLWKNYLICACCLTISGTEKFQQFNVDTRFKENFLIPK